MYFCMASGLIICAAFSTRTLFTNPDALNLFTGKGNWERYRDGTYFKVSRNLLSYIIDVAGNNL